MKSKPEIRRLTKAGGGRSYTVVVPKEFVKQLRWQARQKLELTLEGDKIVIKDWEK